MSRRRRNQELDVAEIVFKLVLLLVLLPALLIGGLGGFAKVFTSLLSLVAVVLMAAAGLVVLWFVGRAIYRHWWVPRSQDVANPTAWAMPPRLGRPDASPVSQPEPPRQWTAATILTALGEIDWFQFERFCAALLCTEGYEVVRKGGARPDGGVDLIAEKGGERILVQCKHWRTWTVKENVIREMLGSMTHFQVRSGAIYVLSGWTRPAGDFAVLHSITLVDGEELAGRALARLSTKELDEVLNLTVHHCPKCEAPMVWREGNFRSFWGCSTYPRCRGTLKHAGAR